jgi:predicted phosphodiesterase
VRYLVLSDIHANLRALTAVLDDAEGAYDTIVNCGDLVGYGPNPNEVVDFCRANCRATIRGNHDRACLGELPPEWFNATAQAAVRWTAATLTRENTDYLAELPAGPLEIDHFDLVHGSPADEDQYLVNRYEAEDASWAVRFPLTFFGHTHLQGGFELHRNGTRLLEQAAVQIEETSAFLINPGSVGQPRDGDPRAAYVLYDSQARAVTYHRVAYDIATVHEEIVNAGLPEALALRLYRGI